MQLGPLMALLNVPSTPADARCDWLCRGRPTRDSGKRRRASGPAPWQHHAAHVADPPQRRVRRPGCRGAQRRTCRWCASLTWSRCATASRDAELIEYCLMAPALGVSGYHVCRSPSPDRGPSLERRMLVAYCAQQGILHTRCTWARSSSTGRCKESAPVLTPPCLTYRPLRLSPALPAQGCLSTTLTRARLFHRRIAMRQLRRSSHKSGIDDRP